jgi:hypothetical protein
MMVSEHNGYEDSNELVFILVVMDDGLYQGVTKSYIVPLNSSLNPLFVMDDGYSESLQVYLYWVPIDNT